MAKSLRQQIEDLQAENEELQTVIDDYEAKFDVIGDQLPDEDESEGEEELEDD